jgi:cytochrome c2
MTVAEICGILWNHTYAMKDRMRVAGIPFPQFEGNELADLISYLHFIGYRGRQGSPSRGAQVFEAKGCGACHVDQRFEAPDLASSHSSDDAIALSAAMWNHAPEMHQAMAEHGVAWPSFEQGDMEDLAAYLRNLPGE